MTPFPPVSADELLRFFDGELSPTEAHGVELRLSESDHATLQAWHTQKSQLRKLGQNLAAAPVPDNLAVTTSQAGRVIARRQTWQHWGGLAATVLLAFGGGWIANGWQRIDANTSVAGSPSTGAAGFPVFSAQAAMAHVTFTPETKHAVEVGAEQEAHLVQWLSKRLGHALRVPDLSAQGLALMGGRLLPGADGARAQFMYEGSGGLRITLYVGALNVAVADSGLSTDTGFSFTKHEHVSSFYWVDQGLGYALSAQMDRQQLLALANAVYRQL